MQRDAVYDLITKISKEDVSKTVLTLRFNSAITLDAVVRFEGEYMVVRGREAGTNDDGRGFFIPYEDILFVKLDRTMRLSDFQRMYGEKITTDGDSILDQEADSAAAAKLAKDNGTAPANISATPAPAMDPAGIAKQNLLARIRAARTAAGSTTGG